MDFRHDRLLIITWLGFRLLSSVLAAYVMAALHTNGYATSYVLSGISMGKILTHVISGPKMDPWSVFFICHHLSSIWAYDVSGKPAAFSANIMELQKYAKRLFDMEYVTIVNLLCTTTHLKKWFLHWVFSTLEGLKLCYFPENSTEFWIGSSTCGWYLLRRCSTGSTVVFSIFLERIPLNKQAYLAGSISVRRLFFNVFTVMVNSSFASISFQILSPQSECRTLTPYQWACAHHPYISSMLVLP